MLFFYLQKFHKCVNWLDYVVLLLIKIQEISPMKYALNKFPMLTVTMTKLNSLVFLRCMHDLA